MKIYLGGRRSKLIRTGIREEGTHGKGSIGFRQNVAWGETRV